ncbi:heme ABC transporter ATP-binding protein [Congregibacter brevis]|uniref:Heme ABC transporter ATP-binding protein n=1 Tax=Congregibacter brevis TaxID=3081201 RepID=A0ABZ0IAR9_9GAMM|nr:heme ABC transporter ATP-binding protein [Congregibacter sp. IMCC45268]
MNSPVLEMQQASLRLAADTVLDNLSFTVASGEILGIAGSNGAGKSSLLRLSCCEHSPSSGRVIFGDEDLASMAPKKRARRMAVLPQAMSLQFDFTVRQVVALGRSPHGDLGGNGEEVIERTMDTCQIRALSDRSYQSLSGGEKQRTQLARVLTQLLPSDRQEDLAGQLLILDEPTSALDVRYQESFLRIIRNLRDRGCAVLLVMHDINLLSRCADKLMLLKSGKILSIGSTKEQLNNASLSEVFSFPIKTMNRDGDALPFVYPDPVANVFEST